MNRQRFLVVTSALALAAGSVVIGVAGGRPAAAHDCTPQERAANPAACGGERGPFPEDFVDIRQVPRVDNQPRFQRGGSRGSFISRCGRNENGHYNSDNFIISPGVVNGAHHLHDYVGNLSTDAFSTDESLAAAGTTCRLGDKSTYFWPVLRAIPPLDGRGSRTPDRDRRNRNRPDGDSFDRNPQTPDPRNRNDQDFIAPDREFGERGDRDRNRFDRDDGEPDFRWRNLRNTDIQDRILIDRGDRRLNILPQNPENRDNSALGHQNDGQSFRGNRRNIGNNDNNQNPGDGNQDGNQNQNPGQNPDQNRDRGQNPDQNTPAPSPAPTAGAEHSNVGTVLRPTSVLIQFRGNPVSRVTAMPRFLRVITGDARAATNGGANARAQWTCTGFTDRITTRYPLCPRGSQVVRIADFPSCWDGQNTDSANHRTHIVFPDESGRCPQGTRAVPQLRITLTYRVPPGMSFAVDSFPEQLHNPITDHNDFVNVMPERLMRFVVSCINSGRRC